MIVRSRAGLIFLLAGAALAACAPAPAPEGPNYRIEGLPERLSEWGVLRARDGVLELAPGALR